MPERLSVALGGSATTAVLYAAAEPRHAATLILAPGAGAGQASGFMVGFARALAARGVDVMTFDFPYIEQKRKTPDRPPVLEACFRSVTAAARAHARLAGNAVFIGGKSMGGRIASHLCADDDVAPALSGLVLLGYPLHPPGKPEQLRVAHLPRLRVPVLLVQGERDAFGTPDEIRPHLVTVTPPVTLHVVEGGDHSLVPPRRAGTTVEDAYRAIQDRIASWIADVSGTRRRDAP